MVVLILLVLAVLLLFPYGMAAYHQYRMAVRLRHKGSEYGYSFRWLRKKPHLPRNFSRSYDFCMEDAHTVYLVKLFAAYRKGRVLVLGADGRIALRSRRKKPMEIHVEPRQHKPRRRFEKISAVPKTRLPHRLPREKELCCILLTYPVFEAVLRRTSGEELPIVPGDRIHDKCLETPSTFEKRLMPKN